MGNTAASDSLEHLLANAAWARRLARRLTGSVQMPTTWCKTRCWSMERPSAPSGAVRPWLTTVLTNLFRSKRRSAQRRSRREQAPGEPIHAPGADEAWMALLVPFGRTQVGER